ncbi:MAG TPA: TetR/AcrR family transcriptional regulator [Euzebyales bacterium]|nr:TetR/AcrR family transcriptional regulator [Euzebyales bacterium]
MDAETVATKDVHTRMLDAAQRRFYTEGITATGVDALAEEAGVSKRTLYNHFGSKDGLVTAYLHRREERWRRRVADLLDRAGDDPIARLCAYVRGYGERPDGTTFRGCAFINAAAELADDGHPALGVVRGSIDNVERGLRQILVDAGVADADALAAQILLVLEGAIAVGGIRRSEDAFDEAERLIARLVTPHLPSAIGS